MSWSYRLVRSRELLPPDGTDYGEYLTLAEVYWVDGQDGVKARGWCTARFVGETPEAVLEILLKAHRDASGHEIVNDWEMGATEEFEF